MKTIIKDLTGEMPVESIDGKINDILNQFDTRKDCSGWGDAVAAIKSLFADKPKGKPIELVKVITVDGNVTGSELTPSEMKSITLLCRNYGDGFDAMFAEGIGGVPLLYLGHWNGGYVENNDNS